VSAKKSADWKVLSIHQPSPTRYGEASSVVLQIVSPAGNVRSIPLPWSKLAQIARQSAAEIERFMEEWAAEGKDEP
jgi:hypothetical protein